MKTFVPSLFLTLALILGQTHITVAGDLKTPTHLVKKTNKAGIQDPIENPYGIRQFFWAVLYTNTGVVEDGNVVAFDEIFNNGIDGDDALKMMNPGENFGIIRNDALLSVEARSPVQPGDTIFYNMQNLRQQGYQLRFNPVNMGSNGLTAYLVDQYLHINTYIDLSVSSSIDIDITADAGSSAADRFYIIFTKGRMLELNFISLSATWNIDKAIELKWQVENERDVDHYTVERSNNGLDFIPIGTKTPVGNNGGTETYDTKDLNANKSGHYYRISAIDHYGQVKYSAIVNSGILEDATISIYPNPVKDKTINIHFINKPTGTYRLQLSNKMGQVVYSNKIDITSINEIKTIRLDNIITIGTYQLSIIPAMGNKITRQVMIQ